jgi:hypothetical protein
VVFVTFVVFVVDRRGVVDTMFAAMFSPWPEDAAALVACARAFSPRVERLLGGRLVVFDAAGLGRIVGEPSVLAREIEGHLAIGRSRDRAIARSALAPSRLAAILLALGRPGTTIVPPGRSAAAVGALSLDVFDRLAALDGPKRRPCALCVFCAASHRQARMRCGQPGGACTELPALRRWGLATLGDLAALPAADLAARLGQAGVALQRLARAADAQPLVPVVDEERFEAALDLEWPIEALEPLSFVLTRLLEPLSAALARADRGAAALVTELVLVRLPGQGDLAIARSSHRAKGTDPDLAIARSSHRAKGTDPDLAIARSSHRAKGTDRAIARSTSAASSCRRRCATRGCCARSSCSISNRTRPRPASIA